MLKGFNVRDTAEEEEQDETEGAVHMRKSEGLGVTLPNTMAVLLVSVHWDKISRQEPVTCMCSL